VGGYAEGATVPLTERAGSAPEPWKVSPAFGAQAEIDFGQIHSLRKFRARFGESLAAVLNERSTTNALTIMNRFQRCLVCLLACLMAQPNRSVWPSD
jgi:hypothetical protein